MKLKLWTRVRNRYRRVAAKRLARRNVPVRSTVPLISFTFDDFPRSALQVGGRILRQHGAVGTYYASLGLMNQTSPVGQIFSEADLAELVADGHELGCHTFGHCNAWNTKPETFENSILENRRALNRVLPGALFRTMSYPIAEPQPETKRRAGRHFAGCRAGGQAFNVGTMDLNGLQAFFLEQSRDRPERIREMIEENGRARGWLIFATHDIDAHPSRFGCTPEFFEQVVQQAVQSGAQILSVGRALEALQAGTGGSVAGRRRPAGGAGLL